MLRVVAQASGLDTPQWWTRRGWSCCCRQSWARPWPSSRPPSSWRRRTPWRPQPAPAHSIRHAPHHARHGLAQPCPARPGPARGEAEARRRAGGRAGGGMAGGAGRGGAGRGGKVCGAPVVGGEAAGAGGLAAGAEGGTRVGPAPPFGPPGACARLRAPSSTWICTLPRCLAAAAAQPCCSRALANNTLPPSLSLPRCNLCIYLSAI